MPGKRTRTTDKDDQDENREIAKKVRVKSDDEDDLEELADEEIKYGDEYDPEIGIIEKVSLKNFMCHNRLDINLYPNVNFIVGRNGSGKSAILTALVVGLGGKAATTSRGSSIKTFIKDDKQVSEVSVQLKNKGQDAYKPEEYGKSIIVERRFSRDGSSQYKIKDFKGKTVSTKRDELNRILDQFNIQVDNPVTILNQETSKNFLFSKNATDKYKFFLKATQLENIKVDYIQANESRWTAQEILSQREKTLPMLQKEVEEWEQKYKSLESLDKLRKKVTELKNQMAWSFVAQREREFGEATKELKSLESRTHKYYEKVDVSKKAIEELKVQQTGIQTNLQQLAEEGKQLEPQQNISKRNVEEKKKAHRTAVNELRKVDSEIRSIEKDVNAIKERINEIKSSTQNDYEAEKAARELRIAELETSIQQLDAKKKTTEHERSQFVAAVTRAKEEQYRMRAEEMDLCANISQKTRDVQVKKASKTDTMKKYGEWMPKLLQKINEAHTRGRFHKKPKGPIGSMLCLRDPQWALAVECCLKGSMLSFCVHDHHDERELEQLFRQNCPTYKKPSTITARFSEQVYDVSRGRAQGDHPSVLDMLDIEDPTIANCLIDQRGVENVLLIKDAENARQIMMYSPPRNAKEAFTLSGDQMFCLPTFRYYSSSQEKANYLTVNIDDDISSLEEEIAQLENHQQQLRRQAQDVNRTITSNQSKERQCQTRLNKLIEEKGQKEFEITELKSREDPAPIDVTTLEEEVERYNSTTEELQERRLGINSTSTTRKADLVEAEQAYSELRGRLKAISDSVDPVKDDLAKVENEISQAKAALKHYTEKKGEHDRNIQDAKKKQDVLHKVVEDDTAKAEQICAKVSARRSPQNLQAEIQQIEKRIRTEEQNRGDPDEITRRYYETLTQFKKIKQDMQQQITFLNKFNHVMVRRQKQYYNFRQMMALRAKYTFIVMLSSRNYSGKIVFDHKAETLQLVVQPNVVNGDGVKDMKSLSGGERSFATVCFILALWQAVESPCRCLDEFDVFMDMVNRRMAMEMMLSMAKKNKYVQFIFLTPLSTSYVNPQMAHIFKMPTPERGQDTLPFQPVENGEDADETTEETPGPSQSKRKR